MKLEILEGSENYVATVVKLPPKQVVQGLDKLVKVTVFGNDVLTGKNSDENQLYVFFPAECKLSHDYLSNNNEYRHENLNLDPTKKGFFEESGRVKAIKFKGVISTGYIAPVSSLDGVLNDWRYLKVGMEFNVCDGKELCRKYKPVRIQSTTSAESKAQKKLKRFDKLVANQFRFHVNTPQLAKCLHNIKPDDIIVITDKWHGTSAVFSNVLVKKELSWRAKIAQLLGVDVVTTAYDNLYSSLSVIKNQYINKDNNTNQNGGYYNEDIWGTVNNELKGKIEQGITIYGEIVGFLASGKAIQKGYDYGCKLQNMKPYLDKLDTDGTVKLDGIVTRNEHKFLVYRITYTKPNGEVIEFSWQQIKDYCTKYGIDTVKVFYHGKGYEFTHVSGLPTPEAWSEELLKCLSDVYLEKDCTYCTNKVPAEGIVVRIDGKSSYKAYKLKSKRFLEGESKQLDEEAKNNEVNIEEDSVV